MNSRRPIISLLAVVPVSKPVVDELRPLKPLVEIPDPLAWLWWTLGGLVVLGLIAWAIHSWLKRRNAPKPVIIIPPHVRAKERLQRALDLMHTPEAFCVEVSSALRVYLEERFNFRAPERTTEEFLYELQASDLLTAEQKHSLENFLTNCDLVKFAKYDPTEVELKNLHAAAVRLVEETEPRPLPSSPAPATATA